MLGGGLLHTVGKIQDETPVETMCAKVLLLQSVAMLSHAIEIAHRD